MDDPTRSHPSKIPVEADPTDPAERTIDQPPLLARYQNLIFAALILAIGSGIVALISYRPPTVKISLWTPVPTVTPGSLHVYITGAVANPALTITLMPGSRVADAIQAAGGVADNADLTRINQAALLSDGEQVDVPVIGVKGSGTTAAKGTPGDNPTANTLPTLIVQVAVNTATEADLMTLPHCTKDLADRIIAYRDQNGAFKSIADLGHVPGLGKTRLTEWQPLLTFN